jgi:hypothetical protein
LDDNLETLNANTWENRSWDCLDLWYIVSLMVTTSLVLLLKVYQCRRCSSS